MRIQKIERSRSKTAPEEAPPIEEQIDLHALAKEVYKLFKEELEIKRERIGYR